MPALESLTDCRVGSHALVVDLLGTREKMSDPLGFFRALGDILSVTVDSLNEATDIAESKGGIPMYQFGDTVCFPHHDVHALIALGSRLLYRAHDHDVLVQAALSSGPVYDVSDAGNLGLKSKLRSNAKIQCFVGTPLARAHSLLRGVRGPRFLIDAETVQVHPKNDLWARYEGPARHQRKPDDRLSIKCSEVWWWRDVGVGGDLWEQQVLERIASVKSDIAEIRSMEPSPDDPIYDPRLARDRASLEKRLIHLDAYYEMLHA